MKFLTFKLLAAWTDNCVYKNTMERRHLVLVYMVGRGCGFPNVYRTTDSENNLLRFHVKLSSVIEFSWKIVWIKLSSNVYFVESHPTFLV